MLSPLCQVIHHTGRDILHRILFLGITGKSYKTLPLVQTPDHSPQATSDPFPLSPHPWPQSTPVPCQMSARASEHNPHTHVPSMWLSIKYRKSFTVIFK
jgi:hypothetical protein